MTHVTGRKRIGPASLSGRARLLAGSALLAALALPAIPSADRKSVV